MIRLWVPHAGHGFQLAVFALERPTANDKRLPTCYHVKVKRNACSAIIVRVFGYPVSRVHPRSQSVSRNFSPKNFHTLGAFQAIGFLG